jgi:transposase-like protein
MLTEAINILKKLPEAYVGKALESLREIQKQSEKENKPEKPDCPKCGGKKVSRNGHKQGKQAYLCLSCHKSYVETTRTAMAGSHFGEAYWKQVICDTINGVPLETTATNLDIHHETAFNMRHKILYCLEQEEKNNPVMLEGLCELDETYVIESHKGKKLQPDYWRGPRKHGAVAAKPGLSDEYICVCAGVNRDGPAVSMAVNRATPGNEDIKKVFSGRIGGGKTVLFTDEAKSYNVLNDSDKCGVLQISKEHTDSFFNINTVNGYHSMIKERVKASRGYATKYLNRYNALFSKVFRSSDSVVDDIYWMLCDRNDRSRSIAYTQNCELLDI